MMMLTIIVILLFLILASQIKLDIGMVLFLAIAGFVIFYFR